MLLDLWRHRRYIVVNALHDLGSRHSGTTLGWVWILLPSVALIAVYGVVFSKVMPVPRATAGTTAVPFALYLAAGLVLWVGFTESLSRGTQSLIESAPYLKKLPIGESVFVAKSAVAGFFVLVFALTVVCLVSAAVGVPPSPAWLLLLPVAALMCAMAFGMSCILAALNVFFRDVGQALGIILQIWMWLIPVVYVESIVPDWMRILFLANPLYPFLVAVRAILFAGEFPGPGLWLAMGAWTAVFTMGGLAVLAAVRVDLRDAL
jgi:ABC-type polysaccharide/polyol phosphate export permease